MSGLVDKIKGAAHATISKGSKIPLDHGLKENNPEQADVKIGSLSGKTVLVGVPGAFTPPCSSQVPGYLQQAEQFKAKGVQGIYVVAVNDAFTTKAWKEKLGGKDEPFVHFLADDTGAFTKSLGLSFDASGLLGNERSQRYAAIINNGEVQELFVEKDAPEVTVTSADNVLKAIN